MLNIKAVRKNLTQQELADALFCTQQAVNNWETGKTLPATDKIKDICKVCDASLEEILLSRNPIYIEQDISEEIIRDNTELHNKENLSEEEKFRKIFNDTILKKKGRVTYSTKLTEQEMNVYIFFKNLNPKLTIEDFCHILNTIYLLK